MEFIILGLTAALASLLTLFSGFGLGTILTPVFAVFFPLPLAIALTGIVHLLNNFFKLFLFREQANWKIVWKFGIPSLIGAFAGAQALIYFSDLRPLFDYQLGNATFFVTPVKLIIAILLIFFSLAELFTFLNKIEISKGKLLTGGLISGFFGGLSGNQGALRSAFLIKLKLEKAKFIATGVAISLFVDLTRLAVYFDKFLLSNILNHFDTLAIATLSAFAGAFLGSIILRKVTLWFIQLMVSIMIFLLAILLGAGII